MPSTRRTPWLATGFAVGHVLMSVPLVIFLATAAALTGLAVTGVGLVLILPWAPALATFAAVHTRMAGSFLGREVPIAALQQAGLNPWRVVLGWFGQRAFWQLIGWLFFAGTGGLVLSVLAGVLPFGAVAMAILVIVFTTTDQHQTAAAILAPCAVGAALLWWFAADAMMRLRCRVEAAILEPDPQAALERRVADLTASRADTVDLNAAELRRIERDLHDGAQARLVALGMNLGMAADLLERDPALARKLVDEARAATGAALGDLRSVVRGIHPPVLADRGLIGAVQALALDLPIPVTVDAALPDRPPAPVESAVYFAVAEALANVVKHSHASNAWVVIAAPAERLRAVVGDDGRGGAAVGRGSGLSGITRRLAAFDGTMEVSSPPGGPTVVTVEVPCVWSSPRTTPSSATG